MCQPEHRSATAIANLLCAFLAQTSTISAIAQEFVSIFTCSSVAAEPAPVEAPAGLYPAHEYRKLSRSPKASSPTPETWPSEATSLLPKVWFVEHIEHPAI